MNADILLAYYDRIADAPDAIPRLRRFVLDLAVRGKLVPQVEGEEPAAVLLERIAKQYGLKKLPRKLEAEYKDHIPRGWVWARLGDIILLTSGQHLQPNEYSTFNPNGLAYITGPSDFSVHGLKISRTALVRRAVAKKGQLLLTVKGSGLGKAVFCDLPEVAISRQLMALEPLGWSAQLMAIIVDQLSVHLQERARSLIPGIGRADVEDYLFKLPPLAEQRRIVAKVDELMALCDQLEAARVVQEETRDRMAAASLARLNNPDPETFPTDARFALNTLPALTTRPDQVKQLRQTILSLAVRGKLVPQLAGDEPASELIERIHALSEKKRGTKSRYKNPPFVYLKTSPSLLGLPDGWAWACFPELGVLGRGKSKHRPRNDPALYENGQHPFIQTGDVARSNGVIRTFSGSYNDVGLSQSHKWPRGTLCITIAANIADSGVLDFDACFPDSVVGFTPSKIIGDATYFEFFMRTAKARLLEFAPATAQKNINLDVLSQVLIPLPPLPEQHRIVAKVNELMALCDQLEASLTAASTARARLLEAMLHAALAPAALLQSAAE